MEISALAVRSLSALLEQRTGQQLSHYRRWRMETALKPVMRGRDIATLDALAVLVRQPGEAALADAVVDALLNNETFFFRDHSTFQQLAGPGLAMLAERRRAERRLRIWSAGCATGQEAWSLAIAFAEDEARWRDWTIEIVGTDVSQAAIARARDGVYSQFEVQRGLPVTRMIACFEQEGEDWRVRPALRRRVSFRVHNLLDPPPPGRFDVVLCRNVLLYFIAERRAQVFNRLASALADDGLLMLGAGETVLGQTDAFVADRGLRGLYRPRGFAVAA